MTGVVNDVAGSVTYTQNGYVIYADPGATGTSGVGGFNETSGGATKVDDGTCGNWSTQQISGCHGSANNVSWNAAATLVCSACHGDNLRVLDDYAHSYDDPSTDIKAAPPIDNHGYSGLDTDPEAKRKYIGAHTKHLNSSFRLSKGDSCRMCHVGNNHADGIIDVKLDLSAAGINATWTAGADADTAGSCASMAPESCHPTGGTQPTWDSAETFACRNCHGMNGITPSHVTDPIGSNIDLPDNDPDIPVLERMPGNCTWCHIGGHPKEKKVVSITKASPAVVVTENNHNMATNDKVTIHTQSGMIEINNKTFPVTVINATSFSLQGSNTTAYGTFDYGTWIEGNGYGTILIPNDSRVGINYRSGGVHLKANIGARGEKQSEAELCWGCHTPNNISEWGADSAPTKATEFLSGNGNDYNFGQIYLNAAGGTVTSNWLGDGQGAFWRSGNTPGFNYKDGRIRSTHSTDPTGSSALIAGSAYNYSNTANSERLDAVNIIRCSNCHDVHNTNMSPMAADLLDPTGPPYLRGKWKSSPYKEDGAPQLGTSYTAQITTGLPGYGYGPVPRANTSTTQQMGGYWIDQNSGNPTGTWSYETSAALCQLCHSKTVDSLEQAADSGGLWISATNGHANSVLGGTGTGAPNIFLNGAGGRNGTGGAQVDPNPGAWMGFQNSLASNTNTYGYGPRSTDGGYLAPLQTPSKPNISTNLNFGWGVTVDAATIEGGYHQFSCSKCHNPHASRLPKLMITNCLDVARNTWEQSYDTIAENADWSIFNTAASSRSTMKLSHLSTAQNCHRYIDDNGDNVPEEKGWNKVTPW